MARVEEHLAELLGLPVDERAKAARALLDSLDEDGEDSGVEAQVTELIRRMQALQAGQVKLIDDAEARARGMARFRSGRGQGSVRESSPRHWQDKRVRASSTRNGKRESARGCITNLTTRLTSRGSS